MDQHHESSTHRTLIRLCTVMRDVGGVFIEDDKYDIGKFGTAIHPSRIHHYQIGSIMHMTGELGIRLLGQLDRLILAEEQQTHDLKEMIMLQEAYKQQDYQRQKQDEFNAVRTEKLREYLDMLFGNNGEPAQKRPQVQQQNQQRYMGSINQIRKKNPALTDGLAIPRAPKL